MSMKMPLGWRWRRHRWWGGGGVADNGEDDVEASGEGIEVGSEVVVRGGGCGSGGGGAIKGEETLDWIWLC